MPSILVQARTLKNILRYLHLAPEFATTAARIALNDTMRPNSGPGWKLLQQRIQDEVAFPRGYVNDDRLYIASYAADDHLEVSLRGRQRPTSLARFALSHNIKPKGRRTAPAKPIKVQVHHGNVVDLNKAFFVRLKSGRGLTEDRFNLGLAVRLKPGEHLRNKKKFTQLDSGLFLLYGPSVDQVFLDSAIPAIPEVLKEVDVEFTRQFVRLTKDI